MFHPLRWTRTAIFLFVLNSAAGAFAQLEGDAVHIPVRSNRVELASASTALRVSEGALLRTSADLVMVPVTITDGQNRPVVGLEQNNFQLFENKKPQQIKNFSSEDAPVSVGIILDTSHSMASKLDRARESVRQFCEASNPQDEFFLITFSDEPRLAADFTNRPEKLEDALLTAYSRGRTSLLDAIYLGIQKMKSARYSRRALLIISDGGDNRSRYTEREVRNAVKEGDVLVYAVGTYDRYFSTQEERLGPELLKSVSQVSGGQAYTVTIESDMPEVTRSIGTRLRHQYMLAYRPQGQFRDGKWHKISVKLRLPKSFSLLRVSARTGYYAQGE